MQYSEVKRAGMIDDCLEQFMKLVVQDQILCRSRASIFCYSNNDLTLGRRAKSTYGAAILLPNGSKFEKNHSILQINPQNFQEIRLDIRP